MMIEAKIILITGGAGFIGFRAAELLAKKNSVTVVDNFLRRKPDETFRSLIKSGGVELIEGDLSSSEFVSKLPDVDFVFHFAALNGTSNFYEYPFSVIKAAALPTLKLPYLSESSMAAAPFRVAALMASSGSIFWRIHANETTKFIFPEGAEPGL